MKRAQAIEKGTSHVWVPRQVVGSMTAVYLEASSLHFNPLFTRIVPKQHHILVVHRHFPDHLGMGRKWSKLEPRH